MLHELSKVMHMSDNTLVKQYIIYYQTFMKKDTWVTIMHRLAEDYQMNLSQDPAKFHRNCKTVDRPNYVEQWTMNVTDFENIWIYKIFIQNGAMFIRI